MPRPSPIVVRISLISFRLLRPKFFVLSISASVFCTSSRIVRPFAFLRQLYDRTESSSSATLLPRVSVQEPCRMSPPPYPCSSATASRFTQLFTCRRVSLTRGHTALDGVLDPLAHT